MHKKTLIFAAVLLFTGCGLLFAEEEGHKYVGVKKCSMCHRSDAKGNQYKKWLSTRHANAYKVLATPEAETTAKKADVSGNPQEAPQCLKCHVTAYGVSEELLGSGFKKEDGVQCETCHGAGGDYKSMSVMKDRAKAIKAGLEIPAEEVCLKCHNSESPNFPGFDFEEYYESIAHPQP